MSATQLHEPDLESFASPSKLPLTRWQKIENVIWDGGDRSEEERRLVRRLDIFIMFVWTIALRYPAQRLTFSQELGDHRLFSAIARLGQC
jgi:hypothetical protein